MLGYVIRRLMLIPLILAAVNFSGFAYAHYARPIRAARTPYIRALYAFEISSTLMATASLGFLGYYIGGDVWVDVSDFVARRVSGASELGQMFAMPFRLRVNCFG